MNHYNKRNFILTQSVGFTLAKARNLVTAEIDAALKEHDITSQQMGILLSLQRAMASTPFELSTLLGIDTGLMTRVLDKLEDKGLLARSRSGEDRRIVNLNLTEKGSRLAEQIPEIVPPVLNARLTHFSREEFTEFLRLLNKFIASE
ncbi:MarR family winged helix-turn-helix transcriptional regulator [Pseudomonas sp. NPDC087358]|uniref:MarR family winged helix-turn-helix transcriptional regulator n=1 Tax=Pseudomonas sp. NPDC087358 TaxID=3364439 RepID=UPI00384DF6BD